MAAKTLYLAAALLAIAAVAQTTTKIVVSFPAYNVVLSEAFPNADVVLITKGASDPHEYQLTAEDLQMLSSLTPRDVVVLSMHAPFEQKIAEMARDGQIKAKVIDLTKIQQYLTYDNGAVNPHDHGIYPPNVLRLVAAVANATGLRPDLAFLQKLRELNSTYCCRFSGKAVALTPTAQYILYWLGYRDIAVLIKEPGVPPTPQDLQKALQYAKEGAPVLAAVVRGEALRIVDQFRQKAQEAGINPNIITADFSKNYIQTLEAAVRQIAAAQTPTATETTAKQTTQQNTEATQTAHTAAGPEPTIPIAVAATAIVLLAVLLLLRWKKQ
ncbi:ABC transporter substrate-binding protein [Pyrobaculum neutrophilum]|uniref:Periplasmic solute binding protein n=1 Tax=Pyrobaculum neutrophilum (strain DSM 2338 / JCM 9278 / NBRC 100436 / V24Sta) TaxID=444157 RepID=B1YBK1_PYRNV|nr:ABC transporter substrate-binding protein [Pyrobaculum neutrophilum]ACB40803.1 periplasmic solute binding protein [Pyrobaculum neutrophilum V24Sta]